MNNQWNVVSNEGLAVGGFDPIEELSQASFFKNEKPPPAVGSGPFVE